MSPNAPDLRRLRQFIAIGDLGSITAAAASLHISQQALSSSMQQLEKDLNATLFRREGRRLTLTPAGELLLAEGRALLAAARTVSERVQQAAGGDAEVFVIGHTPAVSGTEAYTLLEPAITAFPEASFTFRQLYPDQLNDAVLDGTVQLGLRRGVLPTNELATAILGYDRVRLALPREHRLADRASVDIHELAGDRIALWAPPGTSYYSDFLMAACRRAGFEPDYVVSRVQGAATVAAPLTTGAATFVTTAPGPAMGGRVVVIELEPPLLVGAQAMWQRHTTSAIRDVLLAK
ncbi:LysR family transcriptional regulator [Mycolicibacterium fortuitum]|uniref:Probable hydrogen peroxide-inducible genes activator n=1 Tax=Mycolicibacterium fortuitum subsp. fortuitum DSM 46621 = ATCC 6841 = JCM 6387 TaxID=1214102 RepID=K0VG15_MYCFO|nr:LysR family transcriptional regulator [Mycolicibacterium fortuitum]CRL77449.1 transcriptional regulator [Mycolicibacter nonchromogenicus]AMD55198.1 transcriptional regulator [Mycolicibacterium fortuitum subsp. fortuitum DSM 46621 = ATCC 6841 = JCM 6387]EJZ13813.1 transcriptional regulator [Mycolicibacterium fortuitum subsp. fortuitum DSM 46621 = ATCC 6841 = JCM 6387]OBG53623.1 transcriptional regulator [Mycolicibacterium fortuitum]OBK65318.1 transcriptional regulator [Mycolicibacterium fort